MKDQASFTGINWSGKKLIFSINSSLKHPGGLTFFVPFNYGEKKITRITRNGGDLPFITKSIKGSVYAFATVQPGENYSIVVDYTNESLVSTKN